MAVSENTGGGGRKFCIRQYGFIASGVHNHGRAEDAKAEYTAPSPFDHLIGKPQTVTKDSEIGVKRNKIEDRNNTRASMMMATERNSHFGGY